MALFHDITESRSGDQNWVNKKYVKVYEDEILKDQLNKIVDDNEIYTLIQEYSKKKTKASKIAKDADLLDQLYLLKEYIHTGSKEAECWLMEKIQVKMLFSKTAKLIAKKIETEHVHSWWDTIWTSQRR